MKKVLGVRCDNKGFSFALAEGNKKKPILIDFGSIPLPKNFNRGVEHKWLMQEVDKIVVKGEPDIIVVKKNESRTRNSAAEIRSEFEGVIFYVGGNRNIPVFKKAKRTLAKDIVGKGTAKYLDTKLDISNCDGIEGCNDKQKEAVFCAWSELA